MAKKNGGLVVRIATIIAIFIAIFIAMLCTRILKFQLKECEIRQKIEHKLRTRSNNKKSTGSSNIRVLLCGMVRDKARKVKKMKLAARNMLSYFSPTSHVLILENDSKDDTRERLLEWSKEDENVKVIGCGLNEKICQLKTNKTINHEHASGRINKMVLLRNETLRYIRMPEYSDAKYVIMFDFDRPDVPIYGLINFIYEFEKNEKINAQCSLATKINGHYYDPYAHLGLDESMFMCSSTREIEQNLRMYGAGTGIYHVNSCFNGLTMYRRDALLNVEYCTVDVVGEKCEAGTDTSSEAVCEHVCMHSQMEGVYLNTDVVSLDDRFSMQLWYTITDIKNKLNKLISLFLPK